MALERTSIRLWLQEKNKTSGQFWMYLCLMSIMMSNTTFLLPMNCIFVWSIVLSVFWFSQMTATRSEMDQKWDGRCFHTNHLGLLMDAVVFWSAKNMWPDLLPLGHCVEWLMLWTSFCHRTLKVSSITQQMEKTAALTVSKQQWQLCSSWKLLLTPWIQYWCVISDCTMVVAFGHTTKTCKGLMSE